MTENPFASADRSYPVEMPYLSDKIYTLNLQIPAAYIVEELPKSDKYSIGGGQVFYEYQISKDEKTVKLRCQLKIDKNVFSPGEYKALRDFFAAVINKQNEQIVFKLKK